MHVSVADKMSHPHLLGLLFICAWLPQLHTSRNTNEITLSQHIITSNEASKEKFGPNAPPDVHTTPESIATNQAIDHRGTNSSKVSLIIDPTHSHKPKDNEDSKTIYSIAKSLMKSFAVYSISETSTQRINSNSESAPEHTSQSTNQSNDHAITSFYDTSSESTSENTSQSTNQSNDHAITSFYDTSKNTRQSTNQSNDHAITSFYDTSSESTSENTSQSTNQSNDHVITSFYDTSSESTSENTSQSTNQSNDHAITSLYDTSSESKPEHTSQSTNKSNNRAITSFYDTSSESKPEHTSQSTNQRNDHSTTPSYDASSESSSEYTNQPTNQSTEYTSTPSYDTSSESSSEYTNQPTNQSTEDASTPSQCAVPDDVTNLNVKDAPEDFSLSISWEPPYNSYCVMNYSVCWNSATEHNCSTVVDTSLVISQLLACTEYTITVTSVGRVGNSLGVSTIQSSKNVVPGPAVNLSLLSRSAHSLTVNWTEPVANPQCVTNYTLCLNNTISCWTNIRQTVLMIQDSVQPCTDYNVTVFALGQAGVSAGSIIFGRTLANSEYQTTSLAGHCPTVSIRQHFLQDIVQQ
uniref:Fibronectin type-III domain-containing protein n=1 Tax=Timema genevievae TaxID=629358 RepID=A0A7R9PLQ5_TIMGE|nr:unnamed protein product [Timema genevievae]